MEKSRREVDLPSSPRSSLIIKFNDHSTWWGKLLDGGERDGEDVFFQGRSIQAFSRMETFFFHAWKTLLVTRHIRWRISRGENIPSGHRGWKKKGRRRRRWWKQEFRARRVGGKSESGGEIFPAGKGEDKGRKWPSPPLFSSPWSCYDEEEISDTGGKIIQPERYGREWAVSVWWSSGGIKKAWDKVL